LPILDSLLRIRHPRGLASQLVKYAVFFISELAVFSPQLFAWQIMYGSVSNSGYRFGTAGQLFYVASPQILNVLFSSWHGLFTWHPTLLAANPGAGSGRTA